MLDYAMDSQVKSRARTGGPHGTASGGQPRPSRQPSRLRALLAGDTEGNERLTVITGLILIVLLAALGITIVQIGQLIWLHLFLGLLLIGPVALKMASTGYRFVRYYTANARYRVKGPPAPALRMLAPLVVLLTVIVFASGVVLLFIGPGSSLRSNMLLIHKVGFIAWIVVTAVHVLGHLPELVRFNGVSRQTRTEINELRASIPGFGPGAEPPLTARLPGATGRWLSLGTAIAVGLVLALVLIPDFGIWTGGHAFLHHHH